MLLVMNLVNRHYKSVAMESASNGPADFTNLQSPIVVTPIASGPGSVKRRCEVEQQNPDRQIAVVLPSLVEYRWYHYFLHNQRAEVLKTWLTVRGSKRIVVVNVPSYLKE